MPEDENISPNHQPSEESKYYYYENGLMVFTEAFWAPWLLLQNRVAGIAHMVSKRAVLSARIHEDVIHRLETVNCFVELVVQP